MAVSKSDRQKIKWHYDIKNKEWYNGETVAWANDGLNIKKEGSRYELKENYRFIGRFYKLSSAKTVAQLLRHG